MLDGPLRVRRPAVGPPSSPRLGDFARMGYICIPIRYYVPTRERNTRKIQRYANAVQAAGDSFAAPAFTPSGCPYPSALSFFRDLAHTGDAVPLSAGRDIQKFDSEAATCATPTHTSFMVHAAAAAAARGAAKATKQYCVRRLVDDYIVRAVAAALPPVPRPGA